MKKNFEEIQATIEAAAAAKNDKMRAIAKELREAERESKEIETALQDSIGGATPEEYKKLLRARSENADLIDFLKKKQANENGPAVSDEEYKTIAAQIDKEVEALAKDAAPKISKELERVVCLLDEYSKQVEELEAIKHRAYYLNKNTYNNTSNIRNIADFCEDPLFNNYHLLQAYFKQREHIQALEYAVKKNQVSSWIDTEAAAIVKVLRARLK